MTNTPRPRLLRLREVLGARGVQRTKHYEDIAAGLWTRPINLSRPEDGKTARAVAWPQHETDVLIAATIEGRSPDEMRELVAELHAARGRAVALLAPGFIAAKLPHAAA